MAIVFIDSNPIPSVRKGASIDLLWKAYLIGPDVSNDGVGRIDDIVTTIDPTDTSKDIRDKLWTAIESQLDNFKVSALREETLWPIIGRETVLGVIVI